MSDATVTAGYPRNWPLRPLVSDRPSDQGFLWVSTLLFAASAVLTVIGCASMSPSQGMRMPGGWTMSMTWVRMPGQTWLSAAAAFLAMWVVMMMAMMMPSLATMLHRYRRVVGGACKIRLASLTLLVCVGYFCVWTLVGMAVFALGALLTSAEMCLPTLSCAVPISVGAVVLIAGAFQFTTWKLHHLACCREAPRCGHPMTHDSLVAWRYGLRLGIHCGYSCANWTAMLLVLGVMDLRAMAVVTAAITAERLAPGGERVARALGMLSVVGGLVLVSRTIGCW